MCGLTGFVDFTGVSSAGTLQAMADALSHRGPDDQGMQLIPHGDALIGFGFRRLSIIDLSIAGHQPMINELNGDVIMFNGEVYNYAELRKQLESLNHKFKSHSDTEVI